MIHRPALSLLLAASLAGCATRGPDDDMMADMQRQARENARGLMVAQDSLMARQKLMMDMVSNPDLPAWHDAREKLALGVGDRQFDKSFDRVFDSMTVALATLGCRVQNMERASGYITASIPELPPAQREALRDEQLRQYAAAKGYSPKVFDKTGTTLDDYDLDATAMFDRGMSGLTLSMVRQGPETTKVKLRFDNTYYPRLVEEYYRVVWAAVDKQIFLDKGLD